MILVRKIAAMLAVIPLIAGCGGGSSDTFSGPDPTTLSVTSQATNGLTATLTQDKATISQSDVQTYTCSVTNGTSAPISLQAYPAQTSTGAVDLSKTRPIVSLTIKDSSGSIVYPTGVTPSIAQQSFPVVLPVGSTITETQTVQTSAFSRGRFQATATFTIAGADLTNSQQLPAGPLTVSVH